VRHIVFSERFVISITRYPPVTRVKRLAKEQAVYVRGPAMQLLPATMLAALRSCSEKENEGGVSVIAMLMPTDFARLAQLRWSLR
jgi:hypothetical protein